LYPRLAAMGFDITLMRRSCYVNDTLKEYKGVRLIDIYAPRKKSLEAIIHTTLAVIKARRLGVDAVHCHAVGPSIVIPLARLLGLKVVMTHHGPDYDRKKWGRMAKTVLRTGERWGVRNASRVIVISNVINDIIKRKYNRRDASLIFNGVNTPTKSTDTDYITSLGLTPGRYIVALGRFVAEKGFHDLITAFGRSSASSLGYRLVIAGDADHEDEYSTSLKKQAREAGTVLPGFIKGERLNQLMSHAALFVLPSYHEGLPIALLEAMSYNLDVIVSDIPANTIDELEPTDFFRTGDIDSLKTAIDAKLSAGATATPRQYDLSRYSWDTIAAQVADVYRSL
ncbi:MAG: glycosyltransferase family 4 protein, partial [Muribaculaceae bacterium]|nr:glycosyltransferase family 4 protein [Muribaculaceae bacterium]